MTAEDESPNRPPAIVLMSGGIDSAACAHLLLDRGLAPTALFVDHGQAAADAEGRAATSLAVHLGLDLRRVTVAGAEPFASGELVGRNAFLVFTALFLLRARPGVLAMGIHAGTPYYDCSPPFVETMARLVAEHTDGRTTFIAPFLSWTKRDVYEYFQQASIPVDLTYSCERGSTPPCGMCASCSDRKALGC